MKLAIPFAVAITGPRKYLTICAIVALIAILVVGHIFMHLRIDALWRTHIYPDYDDLLVLQRSDGREFHVSLCGIRMPDKAIVPFDIGLTVNADPPFAILFEDVHYIDRSGNSYELIVIDDAKGEHDSASNANQSSGPGGRRVSSKGKYVVLTDNTRVALIGKTSSLVVPIASGGMSTAIEIVTPFSLVKRVQQQPIENPFRQ